MRVWLLTTGEPLPTDNGSPRLHRTGTMAELLRKRGHHVVFWTDTENHFEKTLRKTTSTKVSLAPNYDIWMLHGGLYQRNVSLKRILHHQRIGWLFSRLARTEPEPDVIVSSYPLIELSVAATRYGRERGIPVILDIRDFWPEIFLELVPRWARGPARLALLPMFLGFRKAVRATTAVVGITDAAVDWALSQTGRTRGPLDRSFHLAYSPSRPSDADIATAEAFWDAHGIHGSQNQFVVCLTASLNHRCEADTVIDAAARLTPEQRNRIKIVICGQGETLLSLRAQAQGLNHVLLPGWVDRPKIWVLLQRSSIGLLPYPSSFDFSMSYPNKVGEYFSAGLPILSSTYGQVQLLLEEQQCGFTYPNRNSTALADLLTHLATTPKEHAQLSANSRRVFEEKFNDEMVYNKYADYLEELSTIRRR